MWWGGNGRSEHNWLEAENGCLILRTDLRAKYRRSEIRSYVGLDLVCTQILSEAKSCERLRVWF